MANIDFILYLSKCECKNPHHDHQPEDHRIMCFSTCFLNRGLQHEDWIPRWAFPSKLVLFWGLSRGHVGAVNGSEIRPKIDVDFIVVLFDGSFMYNINSMRVSFFESNTVTFVCKTVT